MSVMKIAWEQNRSRFNHDWLKNQLIAVVLKYKQVRVGLVDNANAKSDLVERLQQWPEYRRIAQSVITQVEIALDAQSPSSSGPIKNDVAAYIGLANEIERQRWILGNNPQQAVDAARKAILCMDYAVFSTLSSSSFSNAEELQPLLDEAIKLSQTFTQLTLCRQIPLPA